MMSYQNRHGTDEAVPFGTTITPSTTTTAGQRSKRIFAIVAAGIMLVTGVVWMQDGESAYNHSSAEGLVLATNPFYTKYPCYPAVGTFDGVSTIMPDGPNGKSSPFETCFQFGSTSSYCWTKSFLYFPNDEDDEVVVANPMDYSQNEYYQCYPLEYGYNAIDAADIKPVTHPSTCGGPCPRVHHRIVSTWVP